MKINTLGQNNLSFGVRMRIRGTKVGDIKRHIQQNPQRKLVGCQKIHILIAQRIYKSSNIKALSALFRSIKLAIIKNRDPLYREALLQSKKNLKQVFFETCDRLFDVQLQDEQDSKNAVLTDISEDIRPRHYISPKERKMLIEYSINKSRGLEKGLSNYQNIVDNINKDLNTDISPRSITNILCPIYNIHPFYKKFTQKNTQIPKTLRNFHQYVMIYNENKVHKAIYNDFDIFKFTIETLNKKFPDNVLKFDEE